jgi:hypothetical protein
MPIPTIHTTKYQVIVSSALTALNHKIYAIAFDNPTNALAWVVEQINLGVQNYYINKIKVEATNFSALAKEGENGIHLHQYYCDTEIKLEDLKRYSDEYLQEKFEQFSKQK